jgi:hypothetical protein
LRRKDDVGQAFQPDVRLESLTYVPDVRLASLTHVPDVRLESLTYGLVSQRSEDRSDAGSGDNRERFGLL